MIEVNVPEAAPVKVAKNAAKGSKGDQGRRRAPLRLRMLRVNCRNSPRQRPKAEARRCEIVHAGIAPGKKVAVISGGKIKIMAAEKAKKAAPTKVTVKEAKPAAKIATKAATKTAAKGAGKTKLLPRSLRSRP